MFDNYRSQLAAARWVKGQITGPISLGLKVVDQNLRPMLYDDTLRDVLVKYMTRKAQWLEGYLARFGTPLTFVDEPFLALVGAATVALNRDEVIRDLEEVYSGLRGLKGTHCCGNTDWGMLLQTSLDVLAFDAYEYAENLALFAGDVKAFLDRGGVVAWGIVPTAADKIASETPEHLVQLLAGAMRLLTDKGIDRDRLYAQALITPACGLAPVPVDAAERAMRLATAVSRWLQDQAARV